MTWEQRPDHLLEIETTMEGSAAVVKLVGELDLASSERLFEEFRQVIDSGATTLVCDVSELAFVDSTGLSMFLMALKRMDANGGSFALRDPTPQVRRILDVAGILSRLAPD
ncbi:MAG TPA: STAS domain-containing protein [Acidimicrobiales bacterium]|jgi:anti-anti-sigma factor